MKQQVVLVVVASRLKKDEKRIFGLVENFEIFLGIGHKQS